jgi:hypothetical protein
MIHKILLIYIYIYMYIYIYIYIYIHIYCAYVGVDNKLYKMRATYIKMVNDVWRNSQYYDNHTKHAVRQNEEFHKVTAVGKYNCHCNLSG